MVVLHTISFPLEQIQVLPMNTHQKITGHGRYCIQNNQFLYQNRIQVENNSNDLKYIYELHQLRKVTMEIVKYIF